MNVENKTLSTAHFQLSTEKNVPKLRFGEFAEEWEVTHLNSLSKIITKGTTPKRFLVGNINFIKIESLVGTSIELDKCTTIDSETHNGELKRSILQENDILFAIAGATVGKVGVVDASVLPANTNQALAIIRLSDSSMLDFTVHILLSRTMKRYIFQSVSVGAQPNLNLEQIGNFKFSAPTLPEQQKIASFLSKVDEKIALLSEKKDKLTEYKRGVMQQLFSGKWKVDNGVLTFTPPTLRFKADDGTEFPDWEVKTLGDISNIKRGASPRPISDPKWFDEKSKVGWVRISDVTRSGRELLKTEQYLTPEGISKSRLIPAGSMIMSICATIGKPIYTTFPVCIHDGFIVFSDLHAHKEYVYYYLSKIEKAWYHYGQPGSQVNLNSDIVSNERIAIPCLDEQIKIANFLLTIDQKIDLTNSELDKAKEWKKGLLQQMFV